MSRKKRDLSLKAGVPAPGEGGMGPLKKLQRMESIPVDLISALAGDRPQTSSEQTFLRRMKASRGEHYYPDILYSITHQHFSPSVAEQLWQEILRHKYELSEKLARNVRITVAALDYLSNVRAELAVSTLISETHFANLANLSMRDGLTGLFNHTSCIELVKMEFELFRRYGSIFSLVVLDIDDFKRVNDEFGHPQGDRVLVEVSSVLAQEVRDSDICCRYGGEEFVVIMPLTGNREALDIAERLRYAIASIRVNGCSVTASFGVATTPDGLLSHFDLIKEADDSLYQAKRAGKNRVVAGAAHSG